MDYPQVNVSKTGTLPFRRESFRLTLPCTGQVTAEVGVTLNVSITSPVPRKPPNVVNFRSKKVCIEGKFCIHVFINIIIISFIIIYLFVQII